MWRPRGSGALLLSVRNDLPRVQQKTARGRKEDVANMRFWSLRVFAPFCEERPDGKVFNRRSQRNAPRRIRNQRLIYRRQQRQQRILVLGPLC